LIPGTSGVGYIMPNGPLATPKGHRARDIGKRVLAEPA
jgi:hypothetical protein